MHCNSIAFAAPLQCNGITSLSPLYLALPCNSGRVSLPRRPPRNVGVNKSPLSVIVFDGKNSEYNGGACDGDGDEALDVVLKLYSGLKNNNIRELSEILADECRCVCNFLAFFQTFQGKKQVLEFFSYLIRIFGKHVQIVVKPTLQDGMNVGVEWKFESDTIHVPLGKGFSFHICQTYRGKALIRNIEMFMEPWLCFEPFRLKMMGGLTMLMEKTGSFIAFNSENKAKRSFSLVLALLSLATFIFFLRLAS
ncbi:putative transmembrane protein [Senna tora]|uniref:Putative transmembrane protein n=1 Tax=Senna tora TaxID=362788 RepID=A0A834SG60_9FABA|nr:putative transmembrane protein [Senna tora]